jgi:hypothetical protein
MDLTAVVESVRNFDGVEQEARALLGEMGADDSEAVRDLPKS